MVSDRMTEICSDIRNFIKTRAKSRRVIYLEMVHALGSKYSPAEIAESRDLLEGMGDVFYKGLDAFHVDRKDKKGFESGYLYALR